MVVCKVDLTLFVLLIVTLFDCDVICKIVEG